MTQIDNQGGEMKTVFISFLSILMCLFLAGCSLLSAPSPKELTEAPTAIIEATSVSAAPTAHSTAIPAAEILNPVTGEEAPTSEPTVEPTAIQHVAMPGVPKYNNDQKVSDCSTGERKMLGATTLIGVDCDNWKKADLERPADVPNGNYIPAVDIVRAQMGAMHGWAFGKVTLYQDAAGNIPSNLSVMLEIDTDLDSRGEYLILASGISTNDWTTNGVQVWWDQTGDVGGEKPHSPDGNSGDGYETLLFDAGLGADPDLAWVRVDPEDGASIEFAFKTDFLPENQIFAWWAWTVLGGLDPVKMEIVDNLSDTASWQMDNTCSWIFNGRPSRMIVNICDYFVPTATPEPTPTPSSSHNSPASAPPCVEPPGGCGALGPGWIFYNCECVLFN